MHSRGSSLRSLCVLAVALLAGALTLSACGSASTVGSGDVAGSGAQASSQDYYYGDVVTPTKAEQVATLDATDAYRREIVSSAEQLGVVEGALSNDLQRGRIEAARADYLDAQALYDVIRPRIAPDSPTAVQADGERWAVGSGQFAGLHLVEDALWGHEPMGAARSAAKVLAVNGPLLAIALLRSIESPQIILTDAQNNVLWAVSTPGSEREELYCHLDLLDLAAASSAAQRALAMTAPLARIVDPSDLSTARQRMDVLEAAVASAGNPRTTSDAQIAPSAMRAIDQDADAAGLALGVLAGYLAGFGSGRLYA